MPRLETNVPEYNLLVLFWKSIRDDITGNGCIDPSAYLIHRRRVWAERYILRQDALTFLDTPDFVNWAQLSGADPDALREDLLHAYLNS